MRFSVKLLSKLASERAGGGSFGDGSFGDSMLMLAPEPLLLQELFLLPRRPVAVTKICFPSRFCTSSASAWKEEDWLANSEPFVWVR